MTLHFTQFYIFYDNNGDDDVDYIISVCVFCVVFFCLLLWVWVFVVSTSVLKFMSMY